MVSLHAFVLAAALAGGNDLVLLDFGADWCAPCRSMEPTLERLEEAGYPIRRVNVERSPELARQFAVGPIPCFVLVKDGREVQRVVGATSYDRLAQLFHQAGYASAVPGDSRVRGQSPDRTLVPPTRAPEPHLVPTGGNLTALGQSAANNGLMSRPPAGAASRSSSVPNSSSTQAHRLALQATVRLRVTDATGQSKGTGTIIDMHGNEALVLTCGHIFRESQGQGEIFVELFAPGARGPVPGHLLVYECDQRDFGLVSIRTDVPVTPAQVAPTTYHPQQDEPIFSVGCDHGADPTVRVSSISAIDRYVGAPGIEVFGHPVEGRSGGGLFTADGKVIGICNAADLEDDRGLYAALPTIYLALDRIGQREIYLNQPAALLSHNTRPSPTPQPMVNTNGQATMPAINPVSRRTPEAAPAAGEVLCIVRAPDGTSRVIVVKNPSTDLLQQMAVESQQQALPAPQRTPGPNRQDVARLSELPSSPRAVVRAQGY